MKWTDRQEEYLRKLCFEERSNAEIAKSLDLDIKEIHAARSRLGITIAKVKAAKAAAAAAAPATSAAKAPAPAPDLWKPINASFIQLEKTLIDAWALAPEPINARHFQMAASAMSAIKSLLVAACQEGLE